MPKIRNASGEDRILPWLGGRLVLDGQIVEVDADDVYAYTQQTAWTPADDDAQAIHDEAESVASQIAEDIAAGDTLTPPAGNATRDAWVAWVIASGLSSEAALEGMGRDAIREQFNPNQEGA